MNGAEAPDRISTDEHIPESCDRFLEQVAVPSPTRFRKLHNREAHWQGLERWIESNTLADIKKLIDAIKVKSLGSFGQLLALTMISAVLRPASSQTQSWGHIADNVWPKEFERKDFYKLCLNWLSRTEGIIKKTGVQPFPNKDQCNIVFWLSSHSWQKGKLPKITPDISVDVLVTSPPYAGAIDYTLSQRLSLYLLGYSEDDVKNLCGLEIGARRKRFLAKSKDDWAQELVSALEQQNSYVSQNGLFAFVLPHKDAGREVGPLNIEEFLLNKGCSKIMEVERSIIQGRARQSWTSIKKEIVQIYG
jgi:RimJ/RimL family protein N-acetyltransferase